MKLQEIIDVIQRRHPNTSRNQIVRLANRAVQDFCQKTSIYEEDFTKVSDADGADDLETTLNKRWYDLPDRIIKVKHLDIKDEEAPMVVGHPLKKDTV